MKAPYMTVAIIADPEYQRLILTFNESLEQVSNSLGENFGVMINHQTVNVVDASVPDTTSGSLSNNQVYLYLDPVLNARGESFDWSDAGITVSYTHPSSDNTPGVQDLAGNDPWSFNAYLTDTLDPNVKITMSDTQLTSGETAQVTFAFSEAVNLSIGDIDFSNANGSIDTISTVDGGKTWTGAFTPYINTTEVGNYITLNPTYTDNNGNTGVQGQSTSFYIDTQAPQLQNSSANSTTHEFTFVFNEALDAVNFADTTMFYATDGTTKDIATGLLVHFDITSVSIDELTATVSIDPSIASTIGTQWTITYTDKPGNDTYALQDIYGADVSSFTQTAVI
jgi:hypothetical protein